MVGVETIIIAFFALTVFLPMAIVIVATTWWLIRRFDLRRSLAVFARKLGISRAAVALVGLVGIGVVALAFQVGSVRVGSDLAGSATLVALTGGLVSLAIGVGNLPPYLAVTRSSFDHAGSTLSGRVAVSGTVEPATETLTSPFGGEECCCGRWWVHERDRSLLGYGRPITTTPYLDTASVPFVLDDGTGEVVVDPAGSRFLFDDTTRLRVPGADEPPATVAAFIADHESLDETETRRTYVESTVRPGDEVVVAGTVTTDADPYPGQPTITGTESRGSLVAAGSPDAVTERLRKRVHYGLGLGFVLIIAGLVALVGSPL